MSALPPKYCPECGDEYVHAMTRCADCDVALVLDAAEVRPDEAPGALPHARELEPLVRGTPRDLEQVAEALAQRGLANRIDTHPPEGGQGLAIYVRPAEHDAAVAALESYRAEQLHDAPAPGEVGAALDACPACGAALSDDAAECPDCGLPFAEA